MFVACELQIRTNKEYSFLKIENDLYRLSRLSRNFSGIYQKRKSPSIEFQILSDCSCWVHVYQTTGAKVRSEKLPSHQDTVFLDIQDLPDGVYVIQVNGETKDTTGSTLVRR